MIRSIRFLMWSTLPMVGIAWGIGLGLLALNWMMGGPGSIVGSYYSSFPIMCLMFCLLFFLGHGSTLAQIALSMGETRRTYSRAVLCLVPLHTLLIAAAACVVAFLPSWLGLDWTDSMMMLTPDNLPIYLLSLLCTSALSPVLGLSMLHSRVLGTVLMILIILLLSMGNILLLVIGATDSFHLWGSLPTIIIVGSCVVTVAALAVFGRLMKTMTVR